MALIHWNLRLSENLTVLPLPSFTVPSSPLCSGAHPPPREILHFHAPTLHGLHSLLPAVLDDTTPAFSHLRTFFFLPFPFPSFFCCLPSCTSTPNHDDCVTSHKVPWVRVHTGVDGVHLGTTSTRQGRPRGGSYVTTTGGRGGADGCKRCPTG